MNTIFEYTLDQAIADGTLIDTAEFAKPVQPKFPLGRVVITANAEGQLHPEDCMASLARHRGGDWGDVCDEDREENERSLRDGSRLLSVYTERGGQTFWIITEADRSATTILLPEDY